METFKNWLETTVALPELTLIVKFSSDQPHWLKEHIIGNIVDKMEIDFSCNTVVDKQQYGNYEYAVRGTRKADSPFDVQRGVNTMHSLYQWFFQLIELEDVSKAQFAVYEDYRGKLKNIYYKELPPGGFDGGDDDDDDDNRPTPPMPSDGKKLDKFNLLAV